MTLLGIAFIAVRFLRQISDRYGGATVATFSLLVEGPDWRYVGRLSGAGAALIGAADTGCVNAGRRVLCAECHRRFSWYGPSAPWSAFQIPGLRIYRTTGLLTLSAIPQVLSGSRVPRAAGRGGCPSPAASKH